MAEPTLAEVSQQVALLDQRLTQMLAPVCESVRMHQTAIYGNNGTPGMLAKLGKIDDLSKKCDEHEELLESHDTVIKEYERLDVLTKVREMFPAYRIVMWVAGLLGVAVIALIWAVLTHSVTIAGKVP